MTTVDRELWLRDPIPFLQDLLREGVGADRRPAIEGELERLREEARGAGWLRRVLLGFPRRPTDR